jgi:hypothetical protein
MNRSGIHDGLNVVPVSESPLRVITPLYSGDILTRLRTFAICARCQHDRKGKYQRQSVHKWSPIFRRINSLSVSVGESEKVHCALKKRCSPKYFALAGWTANVQPALWHPGQQARISLAVFRAVRQPANP